MKNGLNTKFYQLTLKSLTPVHVKLYIYLWFTFHFSYNSHVNLHSYWSCVYAYFIHSLNFSKTKKESE